MRPPQKRSASGAGTGPPPSAQPQPGASRAEARRRLSRRRDAAVGRALTAVAFFRRRAGAIEEREQIAGGAEADHRHRAGIARDWARRRIGVEQLGEEVVIGVALRGHQPEERVGACARPARRSAEAIADRS